MSETPRLPTGLLANAKWPRRWYVRVRLVNGERRYEFTEIHVHNSAETFEALGASPNVRRQSIRL